MSLRAFRQDPDSVASASELLASTRLMDTSSGTSSSSTHAGPVAGTKKGAAAAMGGGGAANDVGSDYTTIVSV
jgi:hypothetical protein